MKNYVCGLMFSKTGQSVALIIKNKPDWQKSLLNGIGGKREIVFHPETERTRAFNGLESSKAAMIREFLEETGVEHLDWDLFLTMGNEKGNSDTGERQTQQDAEGWSVDFYRCFTNKVFNCKTIENEEVKIANVQDLICNYRNTIDNLKWLILLALDKNPKLTKVEY